MTQRCIGILLSVALGFVSSAYAKDSDSTLLTYSHPKNGFRSIQLDAVSLIFINGIAASIDYDLVKLSPRSNFGLRAGYEIYSGFGLEHRTEGSPFGDANLLLRTTTGNSNFRWDIYAGPTYHRSLESKNFTPRFAIRYGIEFRYCAIPHSMYYLLKLNTGAIGLGLSICYDLDE